MFFSFIERDLEFVGELLYIKDEYSLFYNPPNKNVGISILLGDYTSLDTICDNGIVVHISGFNSKHVWIPKRLEMPKANKGELIAHFDNPPLKGAGVDYDRSWYTFCDEKSHCLCIGNPKTKNSDETVEFANGITAVLRKGQLIAVWAKFQEVETAL